LSGGAWLGNGKGTAFAGCPLFLSVASVSAESAAASDQSRRWLFALPTDAGGACRYLVSDGVDLGIVEQHPVPDNVGIISHYLCPLSEFRTAVAG
jgi:hypothetical protein